ncbi:MAG: radical SAM protein [Armatimonadota bacterium]
MRCNARCRFCRIWKDHSPPSSDLPLELGYRLIDDLTRLGARHIDFTGGEPTLYADLPQLLAHARQKGIVTSVTSNGILFHRRAAEFHGQLDSLGFSLNGPNAEIHDRMQGVASFHHVVNSIDRALATNLPVHAHYTATNDSVSCIEPTIAFTRSMGIPLLIFPEFSYFNNAGLSPEYIQHLFRLAKEPGVCINTASLKFYRDGGNSTRRPLCRAGKSSIAIAPDGSLLLPCFHAKVHTVQTHGDLYATYYRKDVQALLNESGRYPFCEGCTNWCYINPSFVYSVNKYTLHHVAFAPRLLREIYHGRWLSKAVSILAR